MRKVVVLFEIFFIVIFITIFFVVQSSYNESYDKVKLSGIVIDIKNNRNISFIKTDEVLAKLTKFNFKKGETLIKKIPLNEIEDFVSKNPYIRNVEAFCDSRGVLNLDVTQFIPVMRFIDAKGESYFIDAQFRVVKHRNSINVFLPMVTQEIDFIPFSELNGKIVVPLEKRNKRERIIYERLYKLKFFSDYILDNKNIECLISQININKSCEIEIIPRLGDHIVCFCDVDKLEECDKYFDKLLKFYNSQSNKGVWMQYNTVNLKFEGQVVCKKNKFVSNGTK